jgi:hypothetical protein
MTIYNTTDPEINSIYEDYIFIKQTSLELNTKIKDLINKRANKRILNKDYDRFLHHNVIKYIPQDQMDKIELINNLYAEEYNWKFTMLTSELLLQRIKKVLKNKLKTRNKKICTKKRIFKVEPRHPPAVLYHPREECQF